MSESKISSRVLRRFVEAVSVELGADQFMAILALSKLPADWAKPKTFLKMNPTESVKVYAALQAALRTYYGRGARGTLLRVGQRLWDLLLQDSALGGKTQAALVKRLPLSTRRHKSTLELLARMIGTESGDITVHTLDLDLIFVDHVSPATDGQRASRPICFVTQGLIQESLRWATKQGFDVEETSCKAMGKQACEFRVTVGRVG